MINVGIIGCGSIARMRHTNVISYMLDYLEGDWNYEVGYGKYEVVRIVEKDNVSEYEGFTGH